MELKKIKLAILLLLLFIIYLIPLSYIEGRSFCILYNYFDFQCLGCGFTRAFFNFSRLNLLKAIEYNKMILILGPLSVYLYISEFIYILKDLKSSNHKPNVIRIFLSYIRKIAF